MQSGTVNVAYLTDMQVLSWDRRMASAKAGMPLRPWVQRQSDNKLLDFSSNVLGPFSPFSLANGRRERESCDSINLGSSPQFLSLPIEVVQSIDLTGGFPDERLLPRNLQSDIDMVY